MKQIPRSLKSDYRPEIDGLRALAVIAVIVDHFNANLLPSGYLGVDIFFVISGYVISGSLYKNSGKDFPDFILGFYSRRVKRLVPALALCVLITGTLICLFDSDPAAPLETGIAALFGLSNIFLWKQATDYFGAPAQLNVFTHTWSLGVEEQFYLFFPFIFWFTGFVRWQKERETAFVRILGLLALCSFVVFLGRGITHSPSTFFMMPTRFWELSAGSLLFVADNTGWHILDLLAKKSISLILLLLLASTLLVPARFPVCATIAVVSLTTLLIASLRPKTAAYEVLACPAAAYIGRISYSLYLWHWSVLAISRWTVGIHWWSAPLQAVVMLILAAGSYRYVENPIRHAQWTSIRWKSILYGLAASGAVAGLLLALAKPLNGRLYTGRIPDLKAAGRESLLDKYSLSGSTNWNGGACVIEDNSEVGKVIPVDGCTLGDFLSAKHRVLVLGNSYSTSFVQSFDQLVLADKYSVTITSSFGSYPVAEVPNNGPWGKADNYYWGQVVPSLLSHLRSGDSVFLIDDLAEFSPESASVSSDRTLEQIRSGLINLSQLLSARGIHLLVLDGLPFARDAECEPVLAARQWFAPFGGPCHFFSKEETLKRRAKLDGTLIDLQDQKRLQTVDLIDIFCPGNLCTYYSANGQMLYRDVYSHPSVEAARLSAPLIRNAILSNVLPLHAP